MPQSERLLVLLRHGQSEWNLKNLFTGWRDVKLSEQGEREARSGGRTLLLIRAPLGNFPGGGPGL